MKKVRIKRTLFMLLVVMLSANCGSSAGIAPTQVPMPSPSLPPTESLFSSDAAVLSDQDIARILSYEYKAPAKSRMAILTIAQPYWFSWSEDSAQQAENLRKGMVEELSTSSAVAKASFLPSFLLPEKRTVGLLREAAARYQADLLLIYRPACRSYERYRLLRSDQTKTTCSIEAALLDVRTGIVPFTSTVSRDVAATKAPEDVSLEETVQKAQLGTLIEASREVASRVKSFLESTASR